MKKILSIVLAIAVLATFSVSAFAATVTTVPGTDAKDVVVKIDSTSADNLEKVYSVDVAWDSLDFTYTFDDNAKNTWNPSTHTYSEENDADANWDKTTANIKVTNHSNEAVGVAAAINTATNNGVTATLSNAAFDLATGTDTIGVKITGVPTVEEDFKLGTITVTISAK